MISCKAACGIESQASVRSRVHVRTFRRWQRHQHNCVPQPFWNGHALLFNGQWSCTRTRHSQLRAATDDGTSAPDDPIPPEIATPDVPSSSPLSGINHSAVTDSTPAQSIHPASAIDQPDESSISPISDPSISPSFTKEQSTAAVVSTPHAPDQSPAVSDDSDGNGTSAAPDSHCSAKPDQDQAASSVEARIESSTAPESEDSFTSSSSVTAAAAGAAGAGPGWRESSSTSSASRPKSSSANQVKDLKLKLFSKLASVDRGIAANFQDTRQIEDVVQQLEGWAGPVELSWSSGSMPELFGNWRLLYSSGFNSGSLGGTRPGPPAAFVPLVLGQVYQRIDNAQGFLDNIVEFMFNYNLPKLPFVSGDPESPAVRLTLRHTFEVMGSNTVEIVYEDTSGELVGASWLDSLPKLDLPSPPDFLKPPKFIRSAKFDVTYLDSELRITRGDRGELRIYLKDHESELPFSDYED